MSSADIDDDDDDDDALIAFNEPIIRVHRLDRLLSIYN